jgi:hypothetical protein
MSAAPAAAKAGSGSTPPVGSPPQPQGQAPAAVQRATTLPTLGSSKPCILVSTAVVWCYKAGALGGIRRSPCPPILRLRSPCMSLVMQVQPKGTAAAATAAAASGSSPDAPPVGRVLTAADLQQLFSGAQGLKRGASWFGACNVPLVHFRTTRLPTIHPRHSRQQLRASCAPAAGAPPGTAAAAGVCVASWDACWGAAGWARHCLCPHPPVWSRQHESRSSRGASPRITAI